MAKILSSIGSQLIKSHKKMGKVLWGQHSIPMYIFSTALASGMPFLVLILYTKLASAAQIGYANVFLTVIAFYIQIVGFGVYSSAQALYYKLTNEDFSRYLNATIFILELSFIVIVVMTILFKKQIAEFVSLPITWIISAVLCALSQNLFSLVTLLIQVQDGAFKYLQAYLIQSAIQIITFLIIIYSLNVQPSEFIIYSVIVASINIIYTKFWINKSFNKKLKFGKTELIGNLKYGITLLPHGLATFFLLGYDKIYVGEHAGAAEIGVYGVILQIGMLLTMVVSAINKSSTPKLYGMLSDGSDKGKITKYTYGAFVGVMFSSIAFYGFSFIFIKYFLGGVYTNGLNYLYIVVIGSILNGFYLIIANLIFYSGKMHFLSFSTILGASLKLLLLGFLFKKLGLYGAALSNVIGLLVMFLVAFFVAFKINDVPFSSISK